MRPILELPRLSMKERDRRYAAVRTQMAARGLDAIVLWGWPLCWDFYTANARYLSPIGGNAEFNVVIFPADGEPTSIIQLPTFLDGWAAALTRCGSMGLKDLLRPAIHWAEAGFPVLPELAGIARARRRVNGISYEELLDVVHLWVDAALRLSGPNVS